MDVGHEMIFVTRDVVKLEISEMDTRIYKIYYK